MWGYSLSRPRLVDGLTFVATRTAISCSRVFVAYTLDRWGAGLVAAEAELVVDELVTTAVQAADVRDEREHWTALTAPEFIAVRLLGLEASIRIEVWDRSLTRPALTNEASAHVRRGSYAVGDRTVVWAELPLLPRRSGPVAPIHLPPPEERWRHQTDPDLLHRVREGLDSL